MSHTPERRLLITGASGAGTTTLGRALATLWAVPHADVDDYFWLPTTPPYVEKRPAGERLALMRALFVPRPAWVLSGSMMGWGRPLEERLSGVVFLALDPETRLQRLFLRESERYGAAIAAGGELENAHREFIDWARGYDDAKFAGRSRVEQEEWLAGLSCPVLRLNSADPLALLVDAVSGWTAGSVTTR
ncbi:hypothetical protein [Winogradskya humida]|uniref:Adenylate kinase family enzyme n=1 Tax=Winogradskya humida TaxID=113566 RepID=A0ABQ3ZYA3_9ACTN|nr:hypothetical protein [Actinoplanes humidus]GIE23566.1 hypothetical protein Ahu01nite_066680 [Actinoplanes humidus]